MRRHRVFLRDLTPGETTLRGPEAHHLLRVLRVEPGAAVRAFDGRGLEAAGTVAGTDEDTVTLLLDAPHVSPVEAPYAITLAVALLKGDKLSDVVRQGTELGVTRFLPIKSRRCDVKVLSDNKRARLQRVATEAAKQSGRSVVPEVGEMVALGGLGVPPSGLGLVAHPTATVSLRDLETPEEGAQVTFLTGPEGGLTDEEVADLQARGFHTVSLGPRILRAETAPLAFAAALLVPEAL